MVAQVDELDGLKNAPAGPDYKDLIGGRAAEMLFNKQMSHVQLTGMSEVCAL